MVGFAELAVWHSKLSNQAENSGCIGLIVSINNGDELPLPSHSNSELLIPFVYISRKDGVNILDSEIGKTAEVEVDILGVSCYPRQNSAKEALTNESVERMQKRRTDPFLFF